jgi:Ca2+-transporting ATPase
VLAVFLLTLVRQQPAIDHEAYVRAVTFTTLVLANLGLIVANLSWTRSVFQVLRSGNRALWYVLAGALLFLGAALYVPFFRSLFRFGTLGVGDVALAFGAAALGVLWFELLKLFRGRRAQPVG